MHNTHEEMQILDSRLYNRKSPKFFEKSTMKEQDKHVSDASSEFSFPWNKQKPRITQLYLLYIHYGN